MINNLIKEFYKKQDEILTQMNNAHKVFIETKPVNIRVTLDGTNVKEVHNVIFKGYDNYNGVIIAKWASIKKDGTMSKTGGTIYVFDDTAIQITFNNDNNNYNN